MRKLYAKPAARRMDLGNEEAKQLLSQVMGSERRRSTRVLIQIPVQAFYRTNGKELRADVFTLAVNAHGCLLEMEIKPDHGQRMRLLNAQTVVAQTGTVVRTQPMRDGSYAVALEFDSPSPHLWSMILPPEDWDLPH